MTINAHLAFFGASAAGYRVGSKQFRPYHVAWPNFDLAFEPVNRLNAPMIIAQQAPSHPLVVLGIETSCDDTAVAIVARSARGEARILSSVVMTDFARHAPYGGVVPEIAARSHVELLDRALGQALDEAGLTPNEINAIAVTAGPGLVGGVMVGLNAAKALAIAWNLPLVPVNHLEGHALSAQITQNIPFPFLLLLISGGHTQIVEVRGLGDYVRLGTTIDDAAGEAFDKTAKLLGLGQPGGPRIEAAARAGDPARYDLPRPLIGRDGYDFSFSGLKTAVRIAAESLVAPTTADVADLAASFQAAAARHLADRLRRAMEAAEKPGVVVVAGGVAANDTIRIALAEAAQSQGFTMVVPPAKLCTDNGAMIAWAGAQRLAAGMTPSRADALAFPARARWPLAPPPEGRAHGGGKRGPKA